MLTSRKTVASIKNTTLSIRRSLKTRWWRGSWLRVRWWWWGGSTRSSSSSASVPVALWVVKTLSNSDSTVTIPLHSLEHVLSKGVDSPVVVIMSQWQERALRWRAAVQSGIEVRLSNTDFGLRIVVPIQSIKVGLDNMVSEVCSTRLAGGVAGEIRWTQVSWEETQDIVDGLLIVVNLSVESSEIEGGKVCVGPGVGCDLVAFTVHTLNVYVSIVVG